MELVTLGIGLQRVQIKLLGVKAIIAKSFDRVHRSNLASSGIVPLCFKSGEEAETLGLTRRLVRKQKPLDLLAMNATQSIFLAISMR
ncbi:hypothetical protein HID58_087795 [Brassica napus]|uniref:BnaC09g31450D protein n=3 Tax=Brassica TaxID=3705 RepID=A0A078G377_BRANA|nr:hypothetical protein HID58_087795 [Brassica napus]CAF1760499.1 unnamed protein product [Brassica napus]CDY19879.1 BnaC09g31450D [Brassica napus]